MKHIFILSFLFFAFCTAASAQDTSRWQRNNLNLRIGPEVGFAVGDFGKTNGTGIGGSATLDIPIAKRFSLIAYAGAKTFSGDAISSSSTKYRRVNVYPLRAGINYKLTTGFYVTGQLGESIVRKDAVTKTSVSQALGIAYFNGFFDVGARWDHEYAHGGLSSINIQATYVITLGMKR